MNVCLKHSNRYKDIGTKISKYRYYVCDDFMYHSAVGISYSYITQIEAPKVVKKMSLEVLFDIADVLDIDIKELF